MDRTGRPAPGTAGFVNYDLWIIGVALLLLGSIIVSQFDRGLRLRREAAATAYLGRVAEYERAGHAGSGVYPVVLPAELVDSAWPLVQLSGDSIGWGAYTRGPAHGWIQVACGIYEGSARHAPRPGMATPGEVSCE